MYSVYVYADTPKMLLDLQTLDYLHVSISIWQICQRTKSNNGAHLTSVRIYMEFYSSLFGISARFMQKIHVSIKGYVFAQIIQSWETVLSKITIRNFCACTQNFPHLY